MRIPIFEDLNIPTDTEPIINNGPEVLQNDINLWASIWDSILSLRSLETILAPTGYPDVILIANANEPSPGTLNIGRIIGSKSTPKNLTTPKLINISDPIKKGSSAGITSVAHIIKPL